MAHIGKGELFGESHAFSREGTLPVSITATTDCRILLIDSRRVTTCCSNACEFHNRVIFNLLRLTASKNQLLHQKLQITARRTTREKLLAYLAFQAKQLGSSEFTIPYDRQALADFLEVDRSGLSAEIGKLRREGVLECRKNSFRLL
jgi:CRP-like cAMP-binding protein